jgi:hypothetical protein
MAESPLHVRALALLLVVSLLGQSALTFAQAAPPPQAPPPAAAPPAQTTYPAQPAPPPSNYQQQQPQGAPPGSFQPAPSPLYPQQQQGYPPPQQAYPQQQYPQQQYPQQQYPQQGYQPGYQQPQGRWQPPHRPRTRKGLMITGISILGGSYLLTVAIASALLDEDEYDPSDYPNQDKVARWLFLPVVGPFIGMSQTDEGDWGLWFLGMLQVVGAGLMIGGIVQYKNSKRAAQMEGFTHWKLPGNRELALDMTTSARSAGPRLKLTF